MNTRKTALPGSMRGLIMLSLAVAVAGALSCQRADERSSAQTPAAPPASGPEARQASGPPVRPVIESVTVETDLVTITGRDFADRVVVNLYQQQGGQAINLGGRGPDGRAAIALRRREANQVEFLVPGRLQTGPFYVELVNPPYGPATTSADVPAARASFARP